MTKFSDVLVLEESLRSAAKAEELVLLVELDHAVGPVRGGHGRRDSGATLNEPFNVRIETFKGNRPDRAVVKFTYPRSSPGYRYEYWVDNALEPVVSDSNRYEVIGTPGSRVRVTVAASRPDGTYSPAITCSIILRAINNKTKGRPYKWNLVGRGTGVQGVETVRLASRAYIDTEANLLYDDWIETPILSESLDDLPGVGDIVVVNPRPSSEVPWVGYRWRGYECRWYVGRQVWPRSRFRPIASTIIESCNSTGPREFTFDLSDSAEHLRVAYSPESRTEAGTAAEVVTRIMQSAGLPPVRFVGVASAVQTYAIRYEIPANATIDEILRTIARSLGCYLRLDAHGEVQIFAINTSAPPVLTLGPDDIYDGGLRMTSSTPAYRTVALELPDGTTRARTTTAITGKIDEILRRETLLTNSAAVDDVMDDLVEYYSLSHPVWELDCYRVAALLEVGDAVAIDHPDLVAAGLVTAMTRSPLGEVSVIEVTVDFGLGAAYKVAEILPGIARDYSDYQLGDNPEQTPVTPDDAPDPEGPVEPEEPPPPPAPPPALTLELATTAPPVNGQVEVEATWTDEFEGTREYLLGVDVSQNATSPQGPVSSGIFRYEGTESSQRFTVAADGSSIQAMLEAQPIDPVEWRPESREGRFVISSPLVLPEQSAAPELQIVDARVTPSRVDAVAECSTIDGDGNPIKTYLQVFYGESGQPLDRSTNRSPGVYNPHLQTITGDPADGLIPDTDYVARFFAEDEGTSTAEAFVNFRTEPALATGGGGAGTLLRPLPAGRNWQLYQDSLYSGADASHPRIVTGQVVDGIECYQHVVRQNDIVEGMYFTSPPVNLPFASHDEVLMRVHFHTTAHSGQPGKHVSLLTGYGYRGDLIQNSNFHYNPFFTYAESFNSRDPGVANIMHPERGTSANGLRLLATQAKDPNFVSGLKNQPALNTPYPSLNNKYYGNNVGAGSTTYPLNQWMVLDVIVHRTNGYTLYRDGVLEAQSDFSFGNQPFDFWDEIYCAASWLRHMHGGTPSQLRALRDYTESWGHFSIWAA